MITGSQFGLKGRSTFICYIRTMNHYTIMYMYNCVYYNVMIYNPKSDNLPPVQWSDSYIDLVSPSTKEVSTINSFHFVI